MKYCLKYLIEEYKLGDQEAYGRVILKCILAKYEDNTKVMSIFVFINLLYSLLSVHLHMLLRDTLHSRGSGHILIVILC
jgi:hypothetical protein